MVDDDDDDMAEEMMYAPVPLGREGRPSIGKVLRYIPSHQAKNKEPQVSWG